MKSKMSKNFESIKVKLSIEEAQKLHKELDRIIQYTWKDIEIIEQLSSILCKTKPIINNDAI